MRPRLITAENRGGVGGGQSGPRRFNEAAAHHRGEHPRNGATDLWKSAGFNEAAAHHRGEHGARDDAAGDRRAASMRPRLITAENLGDVREARRARRLQ